MESFVQKGFVLLLLKPQPVSGTSQCPAVPKCACPWAHLPLEHSLPGTEPHVLWGKGRQGQGKGVLFGSAGRRSTALLCHTMAPCGCLRLAAIHPTPISSCRAETKDSLSAFKIMAIHFKTKHFFFPVVISRNLTWDFRTQGQLPHSLLP